MMNNIINVSNIAGLQRTGFTGRCRMPLAFSPNGDHIAQAADKAVLIEGTGLRWRAAIEVWSRSGKPSTWLPNTHFLNSSLSELSYSRTGEYLVYTDIDGVYLYETREYDLIWKRSYFGGVQPLPGTQFVEDDDETEALLYGGVDDVFKVGLSPYNEPIRVPLDGFVRNGRSLRFSPRGNRLGVWMPGKRAGGDTAVEIWNLTQLRRESVMIPDADVSPTVLAFHVSSPIVAVAIGSKVKVYRLPEAQFCTEIRLPRGAQCLSLDFVADGSLLAAEYILFCPDGDEQFSGALWDWEWGAQLSPGQPIQNPVVAAASHDGREIAFSSNDGIHFLGLPQRLGSTSHTASFSPDYDSQGNPSDHPMFGDDE